MYFLCILALLTCLTARSLSSEYGDLLAPLEGMDNQDKYPNEYLIQFYDNHTLEQHFHIIGQNLSSSPEFRRYTFGYQATIDEKTRDEQVRRDPGVRMVEANSPLYWVEPEDVVVFDHPQLLYNQTSHLHKRAYHTVIQENAPYGLQMITTPSERFDIPIMDGGSYEYLASAGLGVQVYVLDTGIRTTHTLLGGRARHFGGLGPNDISPYTDATMADVRGHGTHVAGIVGAEMYGVAPHVSLINVKVVDNSGLVRDPGRVAQALIDITAEHIRNKKKAKSDPNPWNFRGSVINMSFTWLNHGSAVLYQLIAANAAGISVFGAAGNQNEDYGDRYPCANVQTRCVAAVDATYNKWKASNYGSTINFVAPGKNILSLHSSSDSKVALMSGTSMASPHAAGAAAIFASWAGLETHYDLAENFVYWNSISDVVSGFPSGTSTYLINTGIHSPKKYPNEPFRWGRDGPHKPQAVDDPGSSVIDAWIQSAPPSLPSDALMTGVYTDMATTTVEPVGGLSTLPGVLPDLDFTSSVQSISTSTSRPIPASTTVLACASSGTPFAQPAAQNLISTFCADPMLDVQLVPYIAMGNVSNQLGQTKSLTGEGHFTLDGNTDVIWFRIRFTREACMGSFNGAYQCTDRFSTVLNGCQTNTITAKLGGTLSVNCAEYDLTVVDAHTDPFTDDDSSVGDFTCEDTLSPVADLYPNTCTCWMSERADQTAIFVKPANGACDGNNVDQVNGLASGQGY